MKKLKEWDWGGSHMMPVRLEKESGKVVASVVPNPEPFTKNGQTWGWLWRTPGQKGPERSPASGVAMADRQLRIDGYLPDLGQETFTIPTCGHVTCAHGFMGCIYDQRVKLGITDDDPEMAEPGSEIVMRKVMNVGFPDKDWVLL